LDSRPELGAQAKRFAPALRHLITLIDVNIAELPLRRLEVIRGADAMWKFLFFMVFLLVGCGGDGGYYDMVPPEALEMREDFGGIAIADFNGDGLNDIAVGSETLEDRQLIDESVSIYFQHADSPGSFQAPRRFESLPGGSLTRVLVADDCQRDGLPDLITTNWSEGGFRVLINDPQQPGTFIPSVHYDVGTANSTFGRSHGVGDIDADGFDDVVIVNHDSVQWLAQDSQHLGTYKGPSLIGEGRDDVQLGDVNGDGLLDVVVLGVDGETSQSVLVYYNDTGSPGRFLTPHRLVISDYANYAGVADYDGDGRTDVAIFGEEVRTYELGPAFVVIFRQTQPGRFSRSNVTYTGGNAIFTAFETAHLDHDGFPDLVIQEGPIIRIMESNALATPTLRLELTVPSDPESYSLGTGRLSIGDLNNDTLDDIAIIHSGLYVFFRRAGNELAFEEAVKLNTPL
jgi:hypothetical protein